MSKKQRPPAARGVQLDLPGLKWPDVSIDPLPSIDLTLPPLDLDPLAAVEFVQLPEINLDLLPAPALPAAQRRRRK